MGGKWEKARNDFSFLLIWNEKENMFLMKRNWLCFKNCELKMELNGIRI